MEKEINTKKDFFVSLLCFELVFAFLLFLNAIFPTQSDDLGKKITGIQGAIKVYKTWNGRFGELLLKSFGHYFATSLWFTPINALLGSSVIFLIFINLFGRLPKNTAKDITSFAIIFAFLMIDPVFCFGSVFYWAAGSFNYLLAWFLILLVLTPISLFWHKIETTKKQNIAITAIGIPCGIIAGWSSEFGIVIIILWIASIVYAKIKKIELPKWYYTTLIAFIIGWCILYACPGARVRAKNMKNYMSLTDLIKLGPIDLVKKILLTFNKFRKEFYYESFSFLSIFLLSSCIIYKTSIKQIISSLISIVLMIISLVFLPKLFFIAIAIIIGLINVVMNKKQNIELSYLFIAISVIFIAAFLCIGATIQTSIPRRSCFQYSLLNICLIAINIYILFEKYNTYTNVSKIITLISINFALIWAILIGYECINMNKKWNTMEQSITYQKLNGVNDIVIDSRTFKSKYKNYGDWGNPGKDPKKWPNTSYAKYYGINSITVK